MFPSRQRVFTSSVHMLYDELNFARSGTINHVLKCHLPPPSQNPSDWRIPHNTSKAFQSSDRAIRLAHSEQYGQGSPILRSRHPIGPVKTPRHLIGPFRIKRTRLSNHNAVQTPQQDPSYHNRNRYMHRETKKYFQHNMPKKMTLTINGPTTKHTT